MAGEDGNITIQAKLRGSGTTKTEKKNLAPNAGDTEGIVMRTLPQNQNT